MHLSNQITYFAVRARMVLYINIYVQARLLRYKGNSLQRVKRSQLRFKFTMIELVLSL